MVCIAHHTQAFQGAEAHLSRILRGPAVVGSSLPHFSDNGRRRSAMRFLLLFFLVHTAIAPRFTCVATLLRGGCWQLSMKKTFCYHWGATEGSANPKSGSGLNTEDMCRLQVLL